MNTYGRYLKVMWGTSKHTHCGSSSILVLILLILANHGESKKVPHKCPNFPYWVWSIMAPPCFMSSLLLRNKHDLEVEHKGLFIHSFIYSFMKTQRARQAEEEQAPRRKPHVGLDPGSPGTRPRPKAVLNCWATQGCPHKGLFNMYSSVYNTCKN